MLRKVTFIVLVFLAATFSGRSPFFGQFASLGFADDATVQAAESAAAVSADVQNDNNLAPPALSGTWEGTLKDNANGNADFMFTVTQTGRHLGGVWSDDMGDSGTFRGHVESNGISIVFQFKVSGNPCKLFAAGTFFIGTDEISGTYKSRRCDNKTNGTFDVFQQ